MTSPFDQKTKDKIASLYRDHGLTISLLCERFGTGGFAIKRTLVEAGLIAEASGPPPAKGEIRGQTLDRAFKVLESAAAAGDRCPMNDSVPGRAPSVSRLARQGKIFVEVFVHNFRRVTILEGENKGKSTANPPLRDGKAPKPWLTVGRVKRRNGAVIPSVLDAGGA